MSDADGLERKLAAHSEELATLGREADRMVGDASRRRESLNARAALLVSSAAIASGVQLTGAPGLWQVAALFATFAAALLAIPVLFGHSGKDLNMGAFQRDLYTWSPRRLDLEILNVKRKFMAQDEKSAKGRMRLVRAGFVALAIAIAFTGFQVISVPQVPPTSTVTPTP